MTLSTLRTINETLTVFASWRISLNVAQKSIIKIFQKPFLIQLIQKNVLCCSALKDLIDFHYVIKLTVQEEPMITEGNMHNEKLNKFPGTRHN